MTLTPMETHVMMVPWPSQGHLSPMMQLATTLARRGVLVTFVNTQVTHELLHSAGQIKYNNEETSINFVTFDDGLEKSDYLSKDIIIKECKALMDAGPKLVELGRLLQPQITCVIADMFILSTPGVAQQLGVPHVAIFMQSATSFGTYLFFAHNHSTLKDYLAKHQDTNKRTIDCIPGSPTLNINDLSAFLRCCDPSDFMFNVLTKIFSTTMLDSHESILINTFKDLEPEALLCIQRPNIHIVGPMVPKSFISARQLEDMLNIDKRNSSLRNEDHECLQWLDKQKPNSVLYVAFGSVVTPSVEQIVELVVGIESSGYPMLMVSKDGQKLISDQYGKHNNSSMCVSWAPQLQVLAHPSIGGFLTHAGWNSTIECVSKGVPMLCWPQHSDQMLNTRCIVDSWKIGLDFEVDPRSGLVLRFEIERKVKYLMDLEASKVIRENVNILQQSAIDAYSGESQANFDSLMQVLIGH